MEVTREEAKALATPGGDPYIGRLARTVVALLDENESLCATQNHMANLGGYLLTVNQAQRECIDRLQDGWVLYEPGRAMPGLPADGVHWMRWSPTETEFEPMTPEQAAVMAR